MLEIKRIAVRRDAQTGEKTSVQIAIRGPFRTDSVVQDGGPAEVVIILHPTFLELRTKPVRFEKGKKLKTRVRKGGYTLDYGKLFMQAATQAAAERQREKAKKKRGK